MGNVRRFLVLFMKRIANFFHGQQLSAPAVFIAVSVGWEFAAGNWSVAIFQRNPWEWLFPWIGTAGILGIIEVMLAARDLNRELASKAKNYKPLVVPSRGEGLMPSASRLPGIAIGSIFILFILMFEALAVRAAYPALPSLPLPTPPRPPDIKPRENPKTPPRPSGFIQFDRTELVDDPTIIEAGRRLGFNVYLTNAGHFPVRTPMRLTSFRIAGSATTEKNEVKKQFDKEIAVKRKEYRASSAKLDEIGAGHGVWSTIGTEALSSKEADGIADGTMSVYVLWWAEWNDPTSADPSSKGCWFLQRPPAKILQKDKLTWHFCD